jgi:hypothetical protein
VTVRRLNGNSDDPESPGAGSSPNVDVRRGVDVGWRMVRLLQASVTSLEESATRVVAAQVAGVVALWTQLDSFESGPPRVLAWTAWAILLCAVASVAPIVAPRRLARVWSRIISQAGALTDEGFSIEDESALVRDLTEGFRAQRQRIQLGLQLSVALGVFGLGLAVLSYALEKAFYAP